MKKDDVCQALLEGGANGLKENNSKNSPLENAVSRSHHDCATTIAMWIRDHRPPEAGDEDEDDDEHNDEQPGTTEK